MSDSGLVLAAGAVLWREGEGGIEVLLVERTKHKDISIPKGKLDPGETLPECAAREIEEETGLAVTLGAALAVHEYDLPGGGRKRVHYWQAKVSPEAEARSSFHPNAEIKALKWLPLTTAKRRCSYDLDVAVLDRFTERLEHGQLATVPLVLVRHGKSVPHYEFTGPDAERPLLPLGEAQAAGIAPGIAVFGVERISSSPMLRCQQTAEPLAKRTGLTIKAADALAQGQEEQAQREELDRRVAKTIRKARPRVFVSHEPVLPVVAASIVEVTGARVDGAIRAASRFRPADFSVFHVTPGEAPALVAVEHHSAPVQ